MSSENENQNENPTPNETQEESFDREDQGRRWGGRRRFWIGPFILIAIVAKAAVVMVLWNYLMPDLFHAPELSYIQALGLMILAKLFVGFGHGFGHFRGHHHHGHHGRHRHWRMKRDLWKGMSPEERQKLRQEMRKRWNC